MQVRKPFEKTDFWRRCSSSSWKLLEHSCTCEHVFPGVLEMHLVNLQVRAVFARGDLRGEYQKLAFLPIS